MDEEDHKDHRFTNGAEGAGASENAQASAPSSSEAESALLSLAVAAQIAGISASSETLFRAFPPQDTLSVSMLLLRAAKKIGFKAKDYS